jgi:cation diffusion facilitator family transporter
MTELHHHDHEHVGGVRGVLREIFRPHGHDPSDAIDSTLEASERGIRAVKISFAALMVTAVLQAGVIVLTGSVALLADTIHNFSDALTAVPLFVAFRLARRAPTRRFTYGFGRVEDLAGLFVIAMISLSAAIAAVEAVHRLLHPQSLDHVGWIALAGVVGFVGNELVALFRIREGNAIGSAALVADGHHARTDGFTSLAVVAGAIGVWLGFPAADPIAGLLISVAIVAVLISAGRAVFLRLLNGIDPHVVDEIHHQASHVPGVRSVEQVRARWEGHRIRAELAIDVDPACDIGRAHRIAHDVERRLVHRISHLDAANVHVGPARPSRDAVSAP